MSHFNHIQNKLESFIRRYYTNELIKGAILFFAIGLLYFLLTLFVEYMLWLDQLGRTILFWVFIGVEILLFGKFILLPLTQLFNIREGIDGERASQIIGDHFPEVSDKLLNVLQLRSSKGNSELLVASIEQKSSELSPIPFRLAIDFKRNSKYLKYAAIPIAILLTSLLFGRLSWFSESYERVVNYQTAYEPPAPFQFFVLNENLSATENQPFKVLVKTEGDQIPENAQILLDNESYYMKTIVPGEFEYEITQPRNNFSFRLSSNSITSRSYNVEVIEVPTLLGFDIELDYPAHTRKKDEVLRSIGNAIVPQGTKATWKLNTKATTQITLETPDSTYNLKGADNSFNVSKRLMKSLDYNIKTSNGAIQDYEDLAFSIDVVRDEYPELSVQMHQDSLDIETMFFYGQVSDDYGLKDLKLIYHSTGDEANKQVEELTISKSVFDEFSLIFPDQLNLQEGLSYDLYFEVSDNDAVNGFKTTKSKVFSFRKLTVDEIEQQQLQQQNEAIQDFNNSLEKLEDQDKLLEEISRNQKEKSELNFNDKKKLENFLKRQQQQEEMMQEFNKKLKENLEEFRTGEEDKFKESLKERLKENEDQLKQDEDLLKELEELAEKISKEELSEKLEELAKQNKNKKRSLEQLLELTKRYYVAMKSEKLRVELEELSKEQEKLSNQPKEENTKKEQDAINDKFEDFQKELDELRKDNKDLREPLEQVPNSKRNENDIKKEQQQASENLQKQEETQDPQEQQNSQQDAKKNQRKAAQKMKTMSEKMKQAAVGGGGGEQMSEDIDMLRQILDNLVLFSFNQEDLMERFRGIQINHNEYAKYLRNQQNLKEHFEHVDDSLFALSLRNPMISERINKEITEVFFNIDKSLSLFSENRIYQGVGTQQYTVTAANTLASFLSDVLDNMEMQMNPSPGQGGEGDMQLPDIIMSQEELNKQMQEGMEKKDGQQEGEQEGEKEGQKEGDEGDKQNGKNDGKQEGEGEGNGQEELNGELYEIFQRQQQLRQALENKIAKEGLQGNGDNLLKKMEEVERDLLNKGFTDRTLQKMTQLKHELLKLENATFQQGEDNKRKSETNKKGFVNNANNLLPEIKKNFNTTEILNRQSLPLRQIYKKKVQEYFKNKNDQF